KETELQTWKTFPDRRLPAIWPGSPHGARFAKQNGESNNKI
ncbi:hypothetical protein M8J77_019034, partial [Diaphorina citri]